MAIRNSFIILLALIMGLFVFGCRKEDTAPLEKELETAQQRVTELMEEKNRAMSAKEAAESALSKTESELKKANEAIEQLKSEMSELKAQKEELGSKAAQVDRLEASVKELNTKLNKTQDKLKSAEQARAELQRKVSQLEKSKSSAQSKVEELQNQNAELKKKLSNMKQNISKKIADDSEVMRASDDGKTESSRRARRINRSVSEKEQMAKAKEFQKKRSYETTTEEQGDLEVTFDSTWVSKYIWHGFDLLDDKAAWQPSINVDLWDTGFSFNVWASYAGSSGTDRVSTVNATEWNYTVSYGNTMFEDKRYQADWSVSWIYYDYPDMPSEDADAQEFNMSMEFPNLCPIGTVPHYTFGRIWPSKGDGAVADIGGWFHEFGISYDWAVEGFLPYNDTQVFSLSWDITYNDGYAGSDVDHDWSHMTWAVGTDIMLGEDGKYGSFTPAIYYQTSMDDSVNDEDEFWVGLSYSYTF
jgi:peptidoglycan hydrolase CwlO-like protein